MRATAANRFKVTYDSNGTALLLRIHGSSLTRGATSYNYDVKVFFLHIGLCGGIRLIVEAEVVLARFGGYG